MFGGIRIVWFAEAENRKGTVLSSEPLPELKSFDVELHQRSFPVFQAVFGQTRDMYGKRHMQVSSRNIINTFLESGFGVAYLPKVSVEREVEEGRICEIQTALPKIDLGVILLKNSNHAESSAASLFSKLVKNELYDGKMDRSDFFSRTCLMHRTPNEC